MSAKLCGNHSTPYQDKGPLRCTRPKHHQGKHSAVSPYGDMLYWDWSRHQTCSFYNTQANSTQKKPKKKQYRVWIDQVNQTYVDVAATTPEKASEIGYQKWRREDAHSRVSDVKELKSEP